MVPVTGARTTPSGATTMSAAVCAGVSRSRLSSTVGFVAVAANTIGRAPSLFDSWKATRSTLSAGCTRVSPIVVANGAPAGWATGRTGAAVVVVVGASVVLVVVDGAADADSPVEAERCWGDDGA